MGKMIWFSSQTPKWDLPGARVIQQKPGLVRAIEANTIKYANWLIWINQRGTFYYSSGEAEVLQWESKTQTFGFVN